MHHNDDSESVTKVIRRGFKTPRGSFPQMKCAPQICLVEQWNGDLMSLVGKQMNSYSELIVGRNIIRLSTVMPLQRIDIRDYTMWFYVNYHEITTSCPMRISILAPNYPIHLTIDIKNDHDWERIVDQEVIDMSRILLKQTSVLCYTTVQMRFIINDGTNRTIVKKISLIPSITSENELSI